MQLNKVLKGLMIALPMATLMACSSNDDEQAQQAAQNATAQQEEADRRNAANGANGDNGNVQVGSVEPVMSPAELMNKDKAKLAQQQVVYFDFDRSNVASEFYALLDKHAVFLVKYPSQSIVIEGHTDSRGTPEYNIALGERRAKSIETYLQNAGVSPSQMSVVSYGEEKPVAFGSTEADFARNRRGVLVYQ